LNRGVTIADFQIVDNVDNSYDVQNSSDRGIASEPATFCKNIADSPSGPPDVLGLSLVRRLKTRSAEISTSHIKQSSLTLL